MPIVGPFHHHSALLLFCSPLKISESDSIGHLQFYELAYGLHGSINMLQAG